MIEDALIAAIEADPDDPAPRVVYADWLAERGDPRAELVQLAAQMWQPPIEPVRTCRLYLQRAELARACDPRWLARIEHASFTELRRRLGVVAALDPEHRAPGAMLHHYELMRPLTPAELARVEARLGYALPADYRQFLTAYARGGAGPAYGLNVPWMARTDAAHPGALQLSADGDARFWLIVEGPETGHVVREPTAFAAPMPFLAWYVRWLDDMLWACLEQTRATDQLLARGSDAVAYVNLRECAIVQLPPQLRRLTQVRRLDLENCRQLTELPDWLGELTELTFLSIDHTRVRRLPDALAALHKLRELRCSHSSLEVLPDWIGELGELRELRLAFCALVALPASIGALSHIRSLELYNNRLAALPASIGRMQLRYLRLHNNQLTALPEELGALTELLELNLSHNQLRTLPAALGALPRLTRIDLSGMTLDLADTFRTLARIPTLRAVAIGEGGYTELPPEIGLLTQIESLWFAHNQLTALPAELSRLTRLTAIFPDDNPLPPDAVAGLQLPNLRVTGYR